MKKTDFILKGHHSEFLPRSFAALWQWRGRGSAVLAEAALEAAFM